MDNATAKRFSSTFWMRGAVRRVRLNPMVRRLIESANTAHLNVSRHSTPLALRFPGRSTDQPMASGSPKSHLLGAFPDQFKRCTGCRRRIGEFQFVRHEGGDNSFLIGSSDHVRERASLNFGGDDLIRLVDRVCAEVGDRSLHHGLVFLRSSPIAAVGRKLGEVGAHVHQSKVAVARVDNDAVRIGAINVNFAAIVSHIVRRDKTPGSNQLLFEQLLLGDGIAQKQRTQLRETVVTWWSLRERAKSFHHVSSL